MSRHNRASLAKRTLEDVDRGFYWNRYGTHISIQADVELCLARTRLVTAKELGAIRRDALAQPPEFPSTILEVCNETTLQGISRLTTEEGRTVAALNFASARHPGGGFLTGASAQEESLARSSALYPSLRRVPEYYENNRDCRSALYTDEMILSPSCPIICDDDGNYLDQVQEASFITSPAPNCRDLSPEQKTLVPMTLRQRAENILAVAVSEGYSTLVLGAWGCGVFGNDPIMVAEVFRDLLKGRWAGRFEKVCFSIYDPPHNGRIDPLVNFTFCAFTRAFTAE